MVTAKKTARAKAFSEKSGKAQTALINFDGKTMLEAIEPFLTDIANRQELLFAWSQHYLLPLQGKALEKACSDLMQYFLANTGKFKGHILQDSIYWAGKSTPGHNNLNYALKEWIMSIIVYNHSAQIHFGDDGAPIWNFEDKSPRFTQRDEQYNKTDPDKIIKASGFTIEQKNTIFAGIVAGFLDTPEVKRVPVKKRKTHQKESLETED
jgi:hypothetical protein